MNYIIGIILGTVTYFGLCWIYKGYLRLRKFNDFWDEYDDSNYFE